LLSDNICTTSLFTAGASTSPFWQFTWCSSIIRAKRSLERNLFNNYYYTNLSKQLLRHLRHVQRKLWSFFIKKCFPFDSVKSKDPPVLN
jgi:hypothetical protein